MIDRPTKDVDVVALIEHRSSGITIIKSRPLPALLSDAVARVADQFGIDAHWLNDGPADLIDAGLPAGFEGRLVSLEYGNRLRVHLAGRLDQVCFKTYAAADVAGRHLTDLLALAPSEQDMDFAFRWVMTQDPPQGFRIQLESLADYMEVRHVLDRIER